VAANVAATVAASAASLEAAGTGKKEAATVSEAVPLEEVEAVFGPRKNIKNDA
jgi:hypothetical protein